MDRTENRNEQTVPDCDAGNEQKEMSTHIHFEISGGEYSSAEEKRTTGSKALGVVKGAAIGVGFVAKTALMIGLALRVAKGLKEDDKSDGGTERRSRFF